VVVTDASLKNSVENNQFRKIHNSVQFYKHGQLKQNKVLPFLLVLTLGEKEMKLVNGSQVTAETEMNFWL